MIDQITKGYVVTIEIRANTQSDIDTIWMNIENNLNEDRATYEVKITDRKEIYTIYAYMDPLTQEMYYFQQPGGEK